MTKEELIEVIADHNKEKVDEFIDQNEEINDLEDIVIENLDLMDLMANGSERLEELDKTLREVYTETVMKIQDEAYKKGLEDGLMLKKILD